MRYNVVTTIHSATADKPRDAFVQLQRLADLLKTHPSSYVLPCRIWSFCVKDVSTNTGEPQNWEALELRSIGMRGVADPKIHAPSHTSNFAGLRQKGGRINILRVRKKQDTLFVPIINKVLADFRNSFTVGLGVIDE